ncbi:uncharacterized protein LOC114218739 [Eumetopias jubatus]|nr:uncharacterized protein LOC114218739 [Eumetopias jubatus]
MNTRDGFLFSHFRSQAPHRRLVFGPRVGRVLSACKRDADVLERASEFSCPTVRSFCRLLSAGCSEADDLGKTVWEKANRRKEEKLILLGWIQDSCSKKRLPKMSTQGHTWARQVKKEDEEEDPLDQLISRSGCAASHYAVQECMAQHQDWRQCQPQVQAFRDCMSEQQARRREELQRRKEQGSAHH